MRRQLSSVFNLTFFPSSDVHTASAAYSLLSFFPCCHIIDMQGKADIWHFTGTRSKQRPYSDRGTRLSVVHHTGLQKQNECVGGFLVYAMFFGSWIQKWSPSIMKLLLCKTWRVYIKKKHNSNENQYFSTMSYASLLWFLTFGCEQNKPGWIWSSELLTPSNPPHPPPHFLPFSICVSLESRS